MNRQLIRTSDFEVPVDEFGTDPFSPGEFDDPAEQRWKFGIVARESSYRAYRFNVSVPPDVNSVLTRVSTRGPSSPVIVGEEADTTIWWEPQLNVYSRESLPTWDLYEALEGFVDLSSTSIDVYTLENLELPNIYSFEDAESVSAFLERHKFVVDILQEAAPWIESLFGQDTTVTLKIEYDREDPNDNGEVFANICTELDPDAAMNKLEQLDTEWFLDQIERTQGKLTFDIRFL